MGRLLSHIAERQDGQWRRKAEVHCGSTQHEGFEGESTFLIRCNHQDCNGVVLIFA